MNWFYYILFFCFPVVFASLNLHAQEKPFILLTEEDGLANNDVRDITKDNKGFLWIATSNGLSKYDGEKFVNFGIKQGMPGKWVWAVEHDDKDRIYAACYLNGLVIIENDKIKQVIHLKANKDNTFRKLYYSQKHQILFVGTDYGIYGLKDTILYLISYPNPPSEKSSILDIEELDGKIFFTVHNTYANGGFYRIDIESTNIEKSKVRKIVGGGQGTGSDVINDAVYFNLNNVIFKYNLNIDKTDTVFQTPFQVSTWSLSLFGENEIAQGGIGQNRFLAGLRIFDESKKQIIESPYKLGGATIHNIVHERNTNTTWVCSDIGLAFINNSTPFEFLETGDNSIIKDIESKNDSVFVLTEKDVWLLCNSELKKYLDYNKLNLIAHQQMDVFFKKAATRAVNKNYKLLIMSNEETVIPLNFAKEDDELFLTTSLGTLSIPDLKTYLPIIDGHFIKKDDYGRSFWIPGYDLLRFSENDNDPFYNNYFEPQNKYQVKSIFKVLKGCGAVFLASSFDGVFVIKGNKIYNLNSKNSEIGDNITDIEHDNEGKIWCTTSTGNLFKLDLGDSLYITRKFNEQNSIIVGDSYKWLKFNKPYLYVGTNKGLNKIPIEQLEKERIDSIAFFNQFNGYNFISAESPVTDSEGNIYVHTATKIIKIKNESPAQPILNLDFQDINIDGQNYLFEEFNSITLKSSSGNIRIKFSVLKMPTTKNIEYRYKVNEGVWEAGNSILLPSLKPGDYSIICEASDIETSIHYQKTISFKIGQPLWSSFWFILLVILVISVIVFLFLKVYFTKKKLQQEERNRINNELNDLRIKSLQSQMNPHFIFNSLNSIQNFILSDKTKEAIIYLGSLGKLIRGNLDNVSEEFITLYEEIEFLKNYINIEKLRFKRKLKVELNNNITDLNLLITPMLIQPLIENAIKHGITPKESGGKIIVDLNLNENLIIVTVQDDGVGRNIKNNNSTFHNSKGLDLIKKRIDLLNSKHQTTCNSMDFIDLEKEGNPSGTKVILTLEVHKIK